MAQEKRKRQAAGHKGGKAEVKREATASKRGLIRIVVVVAAVAALALSTVPLALAGAATAHAAGGERIDSDNAAVVGFNPGMIISDEVFYNPNTMDSQAIQNFLNRMGAACIPGKGAAEDGSDVPCLKDYVQATPTLPADDLCGAYVGSPSENAANIIDKVAKACNINPQVILVILQKEQTLITASDSYLQPRRYRSAMGFGCPDTADCDAQYFGFFNQVYQAAKRFQYYRANPTRYRHRAGRVNEVLYHPRRNDDGSYACGSVSIFIENQATAGLYNYTPYTPNAAALAAGGGLGDECSSYGNRNFYRFFTSWFGSTGTSASLVASGRVAGATRIDTAVAISTRSYPNQSERLYLARADRPVDALAGGTLTDGPVVLVPATGAVPQSIYDTMGRLQTKEVVALGGPNAISDQMLQAVAGGRPTQRIYGTDRVTTAISIAHHQFDPTETVDTVYVAEAMGKDGNGSPDAVAAGMLTDGPLLLVRTDDPSSIALVAAEIQRFSPRKVIALGGPAVISDQVLAELGGETTVDRLAGATRYETAAAIANAAYPPQSLTLDPNTGAAVLSDQVLYLARGDVFSDALVAGGLSDGPVLLVPACQSGVPAAVTNYAASAHPKAVIALGGLNATCAHTVDTVVDAVKSGLR